MNNTGRRNRYRCQCGWTVTTIDRAHGVTPFMIRCEQCGKFTAYSSFYRLPPKDREEATQEWIKPNPEQMPLLGPAVLDHVERGGLILRPIGMLTIPERYTR